MTAIAIAQLPSRRYMELIRRFPLRPIRSKAEAQKATGILDNLFGHQHADPGEADYVYILAGLLEEYEDKHSPAPDASPLEVLRLLMEENGVKQLDLAKLLGIGPSAVSMILSGNRPITADHARKLAERFGVDVGVFV